MVLVKKSSLNKVEHICKLVFVEGFVWMERGLNGSQ